MQFQGLGGQFRFYLLKTNLKGDYKPESFKNQCFALKVSKQKGWMELFFNLEQFS